MRKLALFTLIALQLACGRARFEVKSIDPAMNANQASQNDSNEFSGVVSQPDQSTQNVSTSSSNLSFGGFTYPSCSQIKSNISSGSLCSLQKGVAFKGYLTKQAALQGIDLEGSNFLGCDARNFLNGQAADTLGSDLANADGVIIYNITGVNINYDIKVPNKKGFIVLSVMCDDGGSNVGINVSYIANTRLGYRHLGLNSGGSTLRISGLANQARALFQFIDHGGSAVYLNAASTELRFQSERLGGSYLYVNNSVFLNPIDNFDSGAILIP